MSVRPIPDRYHTVTPFMMITDTNREIEWLKEAFGAELVQRMDAPDGSVMHAEVKVGDSIVMLGDGNDSWPAATASFYVYVEQCDEVYKRAVDAGGRSLREPKDEPYGDRSAGVIDPVGNQWWIATHIEDVSPEELERRLADR